MDQGSVIYLDHGIAVTKRIYVCKKEISALLQIQPHLIPPWGILSRGKACIEEAWDGWLLLCCRIQSSTE
jgi:hypothetical protein